MKSQRWIAVGAMCLACLLAAALAACGGGSGGETTLEVPASPTGKAEVAGFDGVHSGEVELALQIDRRRKKPEEVNMRILGSFLKAGEEALPQLDVAIESNGDLAGRHVEFLGSPLLRPERWIVNFDGKVYEPDRATYEGLKSKLEEAQEEEGSAGNAMACVEAGKGLEVTDILQGVSYEGKGEALDGAELESVGGDLDVAAVVDGLNQLREASPGCKAQLDAVGLPPAAELEGLEQDLKSSLVDARLTLSLDKNGVVRYFRILVLVEPQRDEELEVELVMRLNRINEVTGLPITHGYSPWPALLKQFGLSDEDVEQADAGEIYVGILEVLSDRLFGRESG